MDSITLREVVKHKDLVTPPECSIHDTIADLLRLRSPWVLLVAQKRHLLVSSEVSKNQDESYVALLSIADIVRFAVRETELCIQCAEYIGEHIPPTSADDPSVLLPASVHGIIDAVLSTQLTRLIDPDNPLLAFSPDDHLISVWEPLCRGEHAVLIRYGTDDMPNYAMFQQSDLLRALSVTHYVDHVKINTTHCHRTLMMTVDLSIGEVMHLMTRPNSPRAFPVIDPGSHSLVGTFSLSSLQSARFIEALTSLVAFLKPDLFAHEKDTSWNYPVEAFMTRQVRTSGASEPFFRLVKVFLGLEVDTEDSVVHQLWSVSNEECQEVIVPKLESSAKKHQIKVLDDDMEMESRQYVTGVISMTDVLTQVWSIIHQ